MSTMYNEGLWPTPQQRRLLLAAVGDDTRAQTAWAEWAGAVDIDVLDGDSTHLLPLLYPRLQTWGVTHPWLTRLKGIYRRTWYANQLRWPPLVALLGQLDVAGIPTLLLNGPALARHYYQDHGRRALDDVAILVPTPQVHAALVVLQTAGLSPSLPVNRKHAWDASRPLPWTDSAGPALTLHGQAFGLGINPDADADIWRSASPIHFDEATTHILNPADQLLHLMVHGIRWTPDASIRWLADALVVLQASPDLDWARLLALTQRRRLTLPVRDGLTYLADHLGAPIPPSVLAQVRALPSAWGDRLEYQALTQSTNGPLTRLWLHYRRYRRAAPQTPAYARPFGLARFMRDVWGLEHTWQAPVYAVVQGASRLWQWVTR